MKERREEGIGGNDTNPKRERGMPWVAASSSLTLRVTSAVGSRSLFSDFYLTSHRHVNILTHVNIITLDGANQTVAPEKRVKRGLATREQQIMGVIYQLGKASVAEVRKKLTDPPSYSAVRTVIGQLERKGFLRRDRNGVTHLYSPVKSRRSASRTALRSVIETFFPKSPGDAVAALIDDTAKNLTKEDLDRLERAIQRARKGDT